MHHSANFIEHLYEPGAVLNPLWATSHLIFTIELPGGYDFSHFTDKETEAYRGLVTCPSLNNHKMN